MKIFTGKKKKYFFFFLALIESPWPRELERECVVKDEEVEMDKGKV